jgi:KaiC/GvpD/RAD55 family RecA-like ATPase
MLAEALRYAHAGYSVIPVQPRGKVPLCEHGSKDSTTDEGTIRAWWEKWPDANIGVTLENLVVIDIDPRNGGDIDSLPHKLPDTCYALTGGKGWHYAYHVANGAKFPASLGPGIDVKSGRGAYIVVEPSIHASGEKYVWLDESELWAVKPAEAPAWLATPDEKPHEETRHSRATQWLDSIRAGNGLHDSTRDLAAHYASMGLGFEEICKLLEIALHASMAPRDDRWHERFNSIPRQVNTAIVKFREDKKPKLEDLLSAAFWVESARVRTDLPYVVKGLFGKGQVIVFWGPPGSGKTFVTMELACAVGAGAWWRGRRTRPGVVLYVAAESSRPYVENRIAALRRERPEIGAAKVMIVPIALDLLHAQHGDVERVIEAAKTLAKNTGEVVLIIIDTLAVTFGGGDENSSDDMGNYVTNIVRIRQETGAAVLIVHHCGKDEARGMRGHSALLGAIDSELSIEGKPGEEHILKTGKVRDGDGNQDLFAFSLRVVDLGVDQDGDPVTSCVIDSADAAGTANARQKRKSAGLGKNQKAIIRLLSDAGGRISRPELVAKLKEQGVTKTRAYESIGALLDIKLIESIAGISQTELSII